MRLFAAVFIFLAACNQGSDLKYRPPGPPAATASSADIRNVGWAEIKQNVFAANCLECHGPHNEKGLINLTDPAVVRNSIGTIFFVTSVVPSMPPAESGKRLAPERKMILAAWIVAGMPDERGGPAVAPATPEPETEF